MLYSGAKGTMTPDNRYFWLLAARWVAASAAGVLVGSLVSSRFLLGLAAWGLLVSFFQWLLCRKHLEISVGWIFATTLGLALGSQISIFVGTAAFVMIGAILGLCQAKSVSEFFSPVAWIAITVGCWIGASLLGLLVAQIAPQLGREFVLIAGFSLPGAALILRSKAKLAKEDLVMSTFD